VAFNDWFSPIVMGILLGGLYALIALGLSLVFGVMKLINVAHGDLVILGSYIAWVFFTRWGVDPIISLVVGIPVMFFVGFAIQKYLMARAFRISTNTALIIAFGLSTILENGFQMIFTPLTRGLTTSYVLMSFTVLGAPIPLRYLLDFIVAGAGMIFLAQFLKRTYLGKSITAASQDRKAAQLIGINNERTYAMAFGIATSAAAVAGVFLGLTFPFTPMSGTQFLIIAFGVIVLGGLGSVPGTFIGGMIFGLAQSIGGHILGTAGQLLFAYLIVLIVLAAKPQGLFGRSR
jgi:branched-chain amino acid transport system permease protein